MLRCSVRPLFYGQISVAPQHFAALAPARVYAIWRPLPHAHDFAELSAAARHLALAGFAPGHANTVMLKKA
jgi:hypothetical protein